MCHKQALECQEIEVHESSLIYVLSQFLQTCDTVISILLFHGLSCFAFCTVRSVIWWPVYFVQIVSFHATKHVFPSTWWLFPAIFCFPPWPACSINLLPQLSGVWTCHGRTAPLTHTAALCVCPAHWRGHGSSHPVHLQPSAALLDQCCWGFLLWPAPF